MFQSLLTRSKISIHQISSRSASTSALGTVLPRIFGIRDRYNRSSLESSIRNDPLLSKVNAKAPVRVTVTGGAGAIGYGLLFRLANGELLGRDVPIHLRVLELPNAMDAVKGVAMELEDCAFPNLQSLTVSSDANEAFDGCEIALMVGSKPRGPGMERADLLKENGKIFKTLGSVINDTAKDYCRVTVVGNPCNTNCLILSQHAHKLPRENFSAMTRLDHDRCVSMLARKTQLPANEVNRVAIWGNHSATMFVDIDQTTIHGVPWRELIGYLRAERFWRNELMPKVQQRGARIINVRGSSSASSAASACLAHTRDWILGSPQPDWTSMAMISNGEYGVPKGLVYSYPVNCIGGAVEVASYPGSFNDFAQYHVEQNIRELEEERDAVSEYM